MTPEQYTALYAQVQVLIDRYDRMGESINEMRAAAAPKAALARLEASQEALGREIASLKKMLPGDPELRKQRLILAGTVFAALIAALATVLVALLT